MNDVLHPPSLQPVRLHAASRPPTRRNEHEIRLGFAGLDPLSPHLHLLIGDDSWSLRSPHGNDPVSCRYSEARRAVRKVAQVTSSDVAKVGVLHFDHPSGFSQLHGLKRQDDIRRILDALYTPPGVLGTSDLLPSLIAAETLAAKHPEATVTLTILTDWMLTDTDPSEVFGRLAAFPGAVHAVAMNAVPPLDLEMADNTTVTRVSADSPPGMLAAAIAHSITTGRRGRQHAVLKRRRGGLRRGVRR